MTSSHTKSTSLFSEKFLKANVEAGCILSDGPFGSAFNPLRRNLTLEQAKALIGRKIRGLTVTTYRVIQ